MNEKAAPSGTAEEERGETAQALSEANQCIALGVGVGGLGTAASLALGATCPLCFVVAPALVGAGVVRRVAVKRRNRKQK